MFKLKVLASIVFTMATLGTAHASAPGAQVSPIPSYTGELPPVLQSLSAAGSGMKVIKNFDAAGGLGGWVIQDGESGKYVVVYTSPDGEIMLAGLALDKNGENLSALYSEEHLPEPDYSLAFEDFANQSASVTLGDPNAPATIVVAYDANCSFCKALHKLVNPAIEAGELKMQIVPVAILGGDSGAKAAGLLLASDIKEAMQAATYGLGTIQRSNDPAAMAKVMANTELMRKHGFNGTPLVLYETVEGDNKTLNVSNGVPNVRAMFQRLGINGHLDKLEGDESLARFLN